MFTRDTNDLLDDRSDITSVSDTNEIDPPSTPGPGREILGTVHLIS